MPARGRLGRRDRIKEAARAEFAELGYSGARVQSIADRAQVNKQLIFYYFSSKAGLYRSVMEGDARDVCAPSSLAEAESIATRRLRRELDQIYTDLLDRPHLSRLLLLDATQDRLAREIAEAIVTNLVSRISTTITRGQAAGNFRDSCDPETTARHAVSLVLGHLALEELWGIGPAELCRAESLDGICELLLRGLQW
jgi:AcrR family transcriptional regulator